MNQILVQLPCILSDKSKYQSSFFITSQREDQELELKWIRQHNHGGLSFTKTNCFLRKKRMAYMPSRVKKALLLLLKKKQPYTISLHWKGETARLSPSPLPLKNRSNGSWQGFVPPMNIFLCLIIRQQEKHMRFCIGIETAAFVPPAARLWNRKNLSWIVVRNVAGEYSLPLPQRFLY